jgi:hypothetical protein
MADLAYEMNRIFSGNSRGHGEFVIKAQKGAKATGQAKTVGTPADEDLWRKHLAGELGLGVVPIKEDSTCMWGAVDVDEYDGLDLEDWSHKLPEPLVLCRSKSGGAHIFIFTNSPVSAKVLRKKLAMVARAVGFPNAEVFPKQDNLDDTSIGNWINVPYFAGDATVRYCLKGGIALTTEEFIACVAENAISPQQLASLKVDSIFEGADDAEFKDAPPCLQTLVKNGFPPGTRNSALFSMGVYARKKFTTGWEDKIFEYNQRFMGPGSYTEVTAIIRSLNKKSYIYKCKDQPLMAVCDKETCGQCQFGISFSSDDEKTRRPCVLDEVERPVKCYAPAADSKDDPYWVFVINGQSIDVTVDMVRSQGNFAREYLRQYHRVILPIKDAKWVKEMNEILGEAEIHQLAPDAGPEGQLMVHLEDFCTNKAAARVKEELLLGRPWLNDGRIYFKSADLARYLDQQRFKAFKDNEIWVILKRRGGKHHSFTLKGKTIGCWSIPEFSVQSESFDEIEVPNVEF